MNFHDLAILHFIIYFHKPAFPYLEGIITHKMELICIADEDCFTILLLAFCIISLDVKYLNSNVELIFFVAG